MHSLEMTQMSSLHEQRLDQVCRMLKATGARRLLDLGCGSGSLLYRLLAEPQFEQIIGLEQSGLSLAQCRAMLAGYLKEDGSRLRLIAGSYAEKHPELVGFDAAAMVETIEHVPPRDLSKVELAVLGYHRPKHLLITTPNRDYNPLFDLAPGELRDPDHKFEWTRSKFRQWARGLAQRNGYKVGFGGIGELDSELGQPTQTALFSVA